METSEKNLREFVDDLRQEWKLMWRSRIDDKVRAEGIADKDYDRLFVDRGFILFATRNFKPPEFREILERHLSAGEIERFIPDPIRGGVGKFIREFILAQKVKGARRAETACQLEKTKKCQQPKHGGRGWLHLSMNSN